MNYKISGEAEVECNMCACSFFVSGGDIAIQKMGTFKLGLGIETTYAGSSYFTCPNCDKNIEVTYDASEFPEGKLSYSDTGVYGGKLISGFVDIDVSFGEEIYSFDEQARLYIPEKKELLTNLSLCSFDLISAISSNPELLYKIDPRYFEELIATIFLKRGFNVELTKKTRDGGRDIIALRSDLGIQSKYIIECKRYAENRPVGVDLVRKLYGVQVHENANKSILATTSYFTKNAKEFVDESQKVKWAMDLKDYNDILYWLKNIPKT